MVPCTGTSIGGVPDLFALANVVVSSSAAGSVSASLDGPIKVLLIGNLLDSWHEDHSFYTDLDHSGNGYVAAEANQRHGSEQSSGGEQEGGEGGEVDTSRSAFAATNAILAAQAGSGDTLGDFPVAQGGIRRDRARGAGRVQVRRRRPRTIVFYCASTPSRI